MSSRQAPSRAAAAGNFDGPHPRRRWALVARRHGRKLGLGQIESPGQGRGELPDIALAAPGREPRKAAEPAARRRGCLRRLDDDGVPDDLARRDIAVLCELVAQLPHLAHDREAAAATYPVDSRGTAPRFVTGSGSAHQCPGGELLARPLRLAGRLELRRQDVAQLEKHLDVESGVQQPGLRKRTARPVDGAVLLAHRVAEQLLDENGEPDPGVVEQPAGQLGVEQSCRLHAELGEAEQVLAGGMDDPLRVRDCVGERSQRLVGYVAERQRVHQERPGALPAELDQVGALRVAVAGGALGVDGKRSGAGREGRGRRLELCRAS